jgi:transposase-like protein
MLETSTNGAGAAVEAAAAGHEDQGGVAELGFVAGGRAAPAGVPDPELVEQAKRRKFTAKHKLEILEKADACTAPGEIGELLRREGLYTSHLTYWRKQRKDGALRELGQSRGRKPADNRDAQMDLRDNRRMCNGSRQRESLWTSKRRSKSFASRPTPPRMRSARLTLRGSTPVAIRIQAAIASASNGYFPRIRP